MGLFRRQLQQAVGKPKLPVPEKKKIDKIKVLSLAPLLGEAISRIHTGQSVGALFEQQ